MYYQKNSWIVAVMVLCIVACGGDDKKKPTSMKTKKEPAMVQKTMNIKKDVMPMTPTGNMGTVMATVMFKGKIPKRSMLNRKSDPACAKKSMKDETVIVNSNNTLKDVLIRIKPGTVKGPVDMNKEVKIAQHDCMYRPRIQGAVDGQKVSISNDDLTTHNVHVYDMRKGEGEESLYNLAQPRGAAEIKKEIEGYEVMKLKCDVHPWMTGYVVVSDHPFFAVTDNKGMVHLKNVPVGTYTLEAWHGLYGMQTAQVTIAKDSAAKATFIFSGKGA